MSVRRVVGYHDKVANKGDHGTLCREAKHKGGTQDSSMVNTPFRGVFSTPCTAISQSEDINRLLA